MKLKSPNTLKLRNGMRTVKFLLFFFSFIFLVISFKYKIFLKKFNMVIFKAFGILLIVVGSILNVQFKDYLDFQGNTSISNSAIFIITFGVSITVISFFGCTGSLRESRCMMLCVKLYFLGFYFFL